MEEDESTIAEPVNQNDASHLKVRVRRVPLAELKVLYAITMVKD